MYGRIRRAIVHRLGGLFEDEIETRGNMTIIKPKTETLTAIAAFDTVNPLTDPRQNERVRRDLANKIAEDMMKRRMIRYTNERLPPYSYIIRAKAKAVIQEDEWW